MHLIRPHQQAVHTFQKNKEESKKVLLKVVRRVQTIIDRLWMEQGIRSFIEEDEPHQHGHAEDDY